MLRKAYRANNGNRLREGGLGIEAIVPSEHARHGWPQ